ncbi:MAG: peptidylprolyl isomerase [Actinomycetales bacterium]|nr:MAG: peptidylprolyl isomerase [Actinomycetales bacterium]
MDSPPDLEAVRGKSFVATVTTTCGDIVVDLDGAAAPAAVASFVKLANADYWVDTPCHRLTTDGIHVLQCGDPTGTGAGPGPGYHFGVENAPADGQYPAGSVAMARSTDPNSNGDQFFFVHQDTTLPVEGGGYTLFGQVTSGLDLLQRIAAAGAYPPGDGAPLGAISILSVSVQPKA